MKSASIFASLMCVLVMSSATLPAHGQDVAVVPPLHTEGYRIVDSTGHPVRLTSVNWYGFDQKEFVVGGLDHAPLGAIIGQIRQIGVNSVRRPWANETLEHDPAVPDYAVASNPQFKGKHAMAIMDSVIAALARAHIMVILDNHMSRADWCCGETDGNGLWYNREYPETKWLADWQALARRYRNQPWARRSRTGRQSGSGVEPKASHHGGRPRILNQLHRF
jgi:endoglucanase